MKVAMKIPEKGEVFTHKDDDGTMRTFMVCLMKEFADKYATICADIRCAHLKIEAGHVEHVKANMGIEQDRIDRLVDPYLSAPLIGIFWPEGTMTLVDGNHRLVKLHEIGRTHFDCFIFKYPLWEKFLTTIPASEEALTRPSGVLEYEASQNKVGA